MDISKIKVGSTVYDLKDASARTKLSGIEDGAQTHKAPTAAEVKSALGTGSGTSKFLREDGTWSTTTNTAQLQVSDTTNKKINTKQSTSNYIQFTGGTNKFTVTDGTNSFDVAVTPSISNNVTGSGLTADKVVLGNGSSSIKTSSKGIVTTLGSDDTTIPTSKAVQTAITNATSGLTGAMHLIGTTTTALTDGATTATLDGTSLSKKTGFVAGDVVLYSGKEFVWTGAAWELLGDESSYALNTVKVEGTGVLGGGGNLTTNRTITHNTSGITAGSYGPTANVSGSNNSTIKVPQITVDTYGHVTSITERTLTNIDHTYSVNNGTFTVKAEGTAVASTSANASTNTAVDIIGDSNVTVVPDAENNQIKISATQRPIGTGATDAAAGNHTHNVTLSGGSTSKLVTTTITGTNGTETVSKVTKSAGKLVLTSVPNVTGNSSVTASKITGNSSVTANKSTWSFTVGTGDDAETLIIGGGNGSDVSATNTTYESVTATNTTLGTAITAATGSVASDGTGSDIVTAVTISDKTVAKAAASATTVATGSVNSSGTGATVAISLRTGGTATAVS